MQTAISRERKGRIDALGYDYASQPKDAVRACNLCGATVSVTIGHRDRYGYPVTASACPRCGLVWLSPRMTAAAYARFYDGVYRPLVSAFHGRLIDALTIQAEQRDYAAERAEMIRPFWQGAGLRSMLDIGGSTGLVEAHDFGPRRFDAVIVCQTVDHLLDVGGTLRRIHELLTDRGQLFIDIVDFRAAYLRNWSVEDAIKIDHPYYLTQNTMEAYLRRAGFSIAAVDYAVDHLHVSYLCRRGTPAPDALPEPAAVRDLFREIRLVQNAPKGRP